MDAAERAAWERRLDGAQAKIVAGAYDEAIPELHQAAVALRAALGAEDAWVQEVEADLRTAQEMREMWSFGKQLGIRWAGPTEGS
jgi:hypothetical protein